MSFETNVQYDPSPKKSDVLFCNICLANIETTDDYNEYDKLTLCTRCFKKVNMWEKIDIYIKEKPF